MNLDTISILRYDEVLHVKHAKRAKHDPRTGRRDLSMQSIRTNRPSQTPRRHASRRGATTLDYVLVLAVILAMAALLIPMSRHAISVVYEIICTLVAWPFV